MLRHSFEFARCLSFGSKSRPFLCAGPFVSDRTIARYQQAWDVNAKLYLRHPSHIQVSTHHDSVMSVISGTSPLQNGTTSNITFPRINAILMRRSSKSSPQVLSFAQLPPPFHVLPRRSHPVRRGLRVNLSLRCL
jgi:hypothetical protein